MIGFRDVTPHAHRFEIRLETDHRSAAESVREGLDDTLTVLGLNLPETLRRSPTTTNAAESLISRTRYVKRNVKRWRGGMMVVRWGLVISSSVSSWMENVA